MGFTNHIIDERLFRYNTPQFLELLQRFVVLVHSEEDRSPMEFTERILGLYLKRPIQDLYSLVRLL